MTDYNNIDLSKVGNGAKVKFNNVSTTPDDTPETVLLSEAAVSLSQSEPMSPKRAQEWMDRMKSGNRVIFENEPPILKELRDEIKKSAATVLDKTDNYINAMRGRIVSPEIELENKRRRLDLTEEVIESANTAFNPTIRARAVKSEAVSKLIGKQSVADYLGVKTTPLLKPTEAVLVKIQNVRDYFMEHCEELGWEDIRTFSCARMPFPSMVFSYDHEFIRTSDLKIICNRHTDAVARTYSVETFLNALNATRQAEQDRLFLIEEIQKMVPDSVIEIGLAVEGERLPGKWYAFIDEQGQVLSRPDMYSLYLCDPEDEALHRHLDERIQEAHMKFAECDNSRDLYQTAFMRHGAIVLAALQFMNCKNVEVVDNGPTRQQRRHAERSGKKPPVTYKTLVIHPMGRKRAQIARNPDGSTASVSLHIVRGHFKSYQQGAGLGRYHAHGLYWWSPQVRGSADVGRVVKDYEVES